MSSFPIWQACKKASMHCCSRYVLCLLLQIIKKNGLFLCSTNSSFFQKPKQISNDRNWFMVLEYKWQPCKKWRFKFITPFQTSTISYIKSQIGLWNTTDSCWASQGYSNKATKYGHWISWQQCIKPLHDKIKTLEFSPLVIFSVKQTYLEIAIFLSSNLELCSSILDLWIYFIWI